MRLTNINTRRPLFELRSSRRKLENVLDTPIKSFAYPYGAFEQYVANAARDAGYQLASSTRSGWALAGGDTFAVQRLTIKRNGPLNHFARKIALLDNASGLSSVIRYYSGRALSRLGM